jgi:hypothetical protein
MSVYAGPEIVNDGLLLCLDAANPKSYPGTHNFTNVGPELITDINLLTKDDGLFRTVFRNLSTFTPVSLCSVTSGKKYIVEVLTSANRGNQGTVLAVNGNGNNALPVYFITGGYVGRTYRSITASVSGTLTLTPSNVGTDIDIDFVSVKEWYDTSNIVHGQWYDLSGNNNHATFVNDTSILNASGSLLQYDAASYNYSNDYIVAPAGLNQISAPWTMSCWFNMKSEGYDTANKTLALLGGSGTSQTGSGKMLGITSTRRLWGIVYNGTGNQVQQIGTTTINFDTWYHACQTHDGSTVKLYLNGVLDREVDCNGYTPDASGSATLFGIGINRIYWHFGGYISGVQVYSKTLSSQEIQQNFNAIRGRYGI